MLFIDKTISTKLGEPPPETTTTIYLSSSFITANYDLPFHFRVIITVWHANN